MGAKAGSPPVSSRLLVMVLYVAHCNIQTNMPPTAKIPVPTDNYDAPHALVESLTSLRAMAMAVDAALDALEDSVKEQSSRVDVLAERAEAYRTQVDRLAAEGQGGRQPCREGKCDKGENVSCLPQETASPLRLELPASYDRAIGRSTQNGTNNAQDAANIIHASVMAKAREAAYKAVREVLRQDRELDDGLAVLSDAWLDRPTAFDEAAECAAAVESMTVPSLRQQTLGIADEVTWYEQEAGDAAEAAAAAASSLGVGSSTAKSSSEGDDMASVRTEMTGITLSSRMTATTIGADGVNVGGAVERRLQRQQAQLERRRRQRRREQQFQQQQQQQQGGAGGTAGDREGGSSGGSGNATSTAAASAAAAAAAQAAVEDIFDRASAVRQQVLSGSLPYLADVLHDAYGCENNSKPKTADELVAFSSIPPPSSRNKK